jgi:GNAT superfamily N-acetyltransferase
MNVKTAQLEDLEDLLQMVIEYQEEYESINVMDDDVIDGFLKELIADENRGAVFIVRTSSAQAVGFATIYLCPSARNADFAPTLQDLYVRKDYREKGFGRQLFDFAIRWAKKRAYSKLVWSVETMNMTAQYMFDTLEGVSQNGWIGYTLPLDMD